MFADYSRRSWRGRRSPALATVVALSPVLLLALTLTLAFAGCGAGAAGPAGTGGAATSTATAGAAHHPGGTAVRPCPGPYGSASDVHPAPAVLLTTSTPNRSAAAHNGDVIQVRLPSTMRWQYMSDRSVTGRTVAVLQPAGIEDNALNLCVWNFTAQGTGSASLVFDGSPECDVKVPCAQNIQQLTFTVAVTGA